MAFLIDHISAVRACVESTKWWVICKCKRRTSKQCYVNHSDVNHCYVRIESCERQRAKKSQLTEQHCVYWWKEREMWTEQVWEQSLEW